MARTNGILLTRRVIYSFAAVLIWVFLITGIFSILADSYMLGVIWLALTLALIIGLTQRSLLSRLENRRMPVLSAVLVLLILMLVAATELVNLLVTDPSTSINYLFDAMYSLGILVLGVNAGYQTLKSYKEQS